MIARALNWPVLVAGTTMRRRTMTRTTRMATLTTTTTISSTAKVRSRSAPRQQPAAGPGSREPWNARGLSAPCEARHICDLPAAARDRDAVVGRTGVWPAEGPPRPHPLPAPFTPASRRAHAGVGEEDSELGEEEFGEDDGAPLAHMRAFSRGISDAHAPPIPPFRLQP